MNSSDMPWEYSCAVDGCKERLLFWAAPNGRDVAVRDLGWEVDVFAGGGVWVYCPVHISAKETR